jgi:hypothetical protein
LRGGSRGVVRAGADEHRRPVRSGTASGTNGKVGLRRTARAQHARAAEQQARGRRWRRSRTRRRPRHLASGGTSRPQRVREAASSSVCARGSSWSNTPSASRRKKRAAPCSRTFPRGLSIQPREEPPSEPEEFVLVAACAVEGRSVVRRAPRATAGVCQPHRSRRRAAGHSDVRTRAPRRYPSSGGTGPPAGLRSSPLQTR